MTDEDLISEFIRIRRNPSGLKVDALQISWDGPHTPVSRWILAREVSGEVNHSQVNEAIQGVLKDPAFFGRCEECGERKPTGWMHSSSICQGCAQTNHGVVY